MEAVVGRMVPTTVRASVGGHRVEVDFVSQPFGKCVDGELGVIADAIEALVDGTLDACRRMGWKRPNATRVEAATASVLALREGRVRTAWRPTKRIANAVTRRPLTTAQPIVRLMIRSMS